MTHEDKGHFAKKHEKDRDIDTRIAEAIRERVMEGEIPCAVAFSIVGDLKTSPAAVGKAIDLVEKSIVKCQLGLFGYGPQKNMLKPPESVDPELAEAIHKALVDGRLSCRAAWDIADQLDLRKMAISSACEKLGIKISHCQLGTF